MRKHPLSIIVITFWLCLSSIYRSDDSSSGQGNQGGTVRALLTGYQEVPAVSSQGIGQFSAQLSDDKTKINFKLQWKNLEGATIAKAEIRFGQFSVNGDVVALLCGAGATLAHPESLLPDQSKALSELRIFFGPKPRELILLKPRYLMRF